MRWTTYKRAIINKIDTTTKETEHGISYNVFKNIPPLAKLTSKDLYSRVWLCDYPRTTKAQVVEVTDDYIKVKFKGEIPIRAFFPDEVMLHPSEWEDDREKK